MKHIVVEVQTNNDGSVGILSNFYNTDDEAQSKYHDILRAAYRSNLPRHGAFLLTDDGMYVKSEFHINVEGVNEG